MNRGNIYLVVGFLLCAGGLFASSKLSTSRPEPVVQKFHSLQDFEIAAKAASCDPQKFHFGQGVQGDVDGNEIAISSYLSGIVFSMVPGTIVCCEISGDHINPYYCSNEEGEGPVWGLGVGPNPRIKECVVYGEITDWWLYK